MKHLFVLGAAAAALLLAPAVHADSVSTYGDTQVVSVNGTYVWQLTSDASGPNLYSGLNFNFTSAPTLASINDLSADYEVQTGTFGGGAPRFSFADASGNEAYDYWGTSGTLTDPNSPADKTTFVSTGNLADTTSTSDNVGNNNFGENGSNSNNIITYGQLVNGYGSGASAVSGVGSTDVDTISLDLDGGFTGNQVIDISSVTIDGTTYFAPTPEPASIVPFGIAALGLGALMLRARKRQHNA